MTRKFTADDLHAVLDFVDLVGEIHGRELPMWHVSNAAVLSLANEEGKDPKDVVADLATRRRREQDDIAKHAEQRSVENDERNKDG